MPSAPLGIVASQDHFSASGGTVTYSGGYTIHTFNSSGTFTIGAKGKRLIEWEIVGGGGSGGAHSTFQNTKTGDTSYNYYGAGGGGGYVSDSGVLTPYYHPELGTIKTAIPVTVGAGGAAPFYGGGGASGNISNIARTGAEASNLKSDFLIDGKTAGVDQAGGGSNSNGYNATNGVYGTGKAGGGGGGSNITTLGSGGTQYDSVGAGGSGSGGGGNGGAGTFGPTTGGGGGAGGSASGSSGGAGINGYSVGGSGSTGSGWAGAANSGNGGDSARNGGSGKVIIKYLSV